VRRAILFAAAFAAAGSLAAETAVYVARGRDVSLFGPYEISGFRLETVPEPAGVRLIVHSGPAGGDALLPARRRRDGHLPEAPDRDLLARRLTLGRNLESEAVAAVLDWIASNIAYDPDRSRAQDPGAVFSSRRAFCVGYAELAVDILRRAGITAATVQGVLFSDPSAPGYEPALSGIYHRWVKVFYPGQGWKFADPIGGRARVDARYVPFSHRSWTRPEDLRLMKISEATHD
jgi:transglutaminase-like putative cysteine protease